MFGYRYEEGFLTHLLNFIRAETPVEHETTLSSLSLFSGAGISDIGYEQAGFHTVVRSELNDDRCEIASPNFPNAETIRGDIGERTHEIISAYQQSEYDELVLMTVTPPCQGMSSSNPARGRMGDISRRDARNRLMLDACPIINALEPRFIVIENVGMILKEKVEEDGEEHLVINLFHERIGGEETYRLFSTVLQLADYGIPQNRKRALIVAIRHDEACLDYLDQNGLYPWPKATHGEQFTEEVESWITAGQWFESMNYSSLDSLTEEAAHDSNDPLHFVPNYEREPFRYEWIAGIPKCSGLSAYSNDNCPECEKSGIDDSLAHCPYCNAELTNRPYVREKDGTFRLIKGYSTAYRRIPVNRPVPTITTSSSHLGSNYKIHPWENRVLSIRECADLQTVPYFFNWDWAIETEHAYVIRQAIGEALPSYFAYLQGMIIRNLAENNQEYLDYLAPI